MADVSYVSPRFGTGHAEAMQFLREVVLERFARNEFNTLSVVGTLADGNAVQFCVYSVSSNEAMNHNLQHLGLLQKAMLEWSLQVVEDEREK